MISAEQCGLKDIGIDRETRAKAYLRVGGREESFNELINKQSFFALSTENGRGKG